MNIAQRLHNKGRQEGLLEGREEGREEGLKEGRKEGREVEKKAYKTLELPWHVTFLEMALAWKLLWKVQG
ncbi:hypothetical protein [Providencia sp. PROV020]|uniref:hypothetical protein n=1 Tax=Providencia sp. PROV020 TaxID=2949755 RepID=UPI00234AD933|nr:hypothetical protein [Providencia sp. PROV020]